jgi:hypothetical protein
MGYGRLVDDALDSTDPRGYSLDEQVESYEGTVEGLNLAQRRKRTPVYSGVLKYFPNAIKEVSRCSLAGQKQHNHGNELYWDRTKSTDNEDALARHLIDHSIDPMDDDGVLHLAKVAWRALAALEVYLDEQ